MGPLKLPIRGAVYVDTSAVIYMVERVEPYAEHLHPMRQAAEEGHLRLVASVLVLLEALVKPLRDGNAVLVDVYRDALVHSNEFRLAGVDELIAERAAHIRSTTGLSTPDAIHAATALEEHIDLFVTNDSGFQRVPGLPVTLLSQCVDVG